MTADTATNRTHGTGRYAPVNGLGDVLRDPWAQGNPWLSFLAA